MTFEQSNLSVDDYFGCRDLTLKKPVQPKLVGPMPSIEELERYKAALPSYEAELVAYNAQKGKREQIANARRIEFEEYFADYADLPKQYPAKLKKELIQYCLSETDSYESALFLGSELEKFINWRPSA